MYVWICTSNQSAALVTPQSTQSERGMREWHTDRKNIMIVSRELHFRTIICSTRHALRSQQKQKHYRTYRWQNHTEPKSDVSRRQMYAFLLGDNLNGLKFVLEVHLINAIKSVEFALNS